MPDAPTPPPPSSAVPPSGAEANPPAPRKQKRRGWWWKIPLVLIVLLLLLVLLLPTILSTGPVRSAVLNQVNDRFLNGRVEVRDWSFGWFSPLRIDGVRVYDAENKQVAELAKVTTQATLLQLARGNYALGKTVVDGLDADVRRDPDGRLNVEKLTKAQPVAAAATRPNGEVTTTSGPGGTNSRPAKPAEPVRLPGTLSGDITVTNARATITPGNGLPVVKIPALNAELKIPNVNQAIDYALTGTAMVGDGREGKVSLAGTADVGENDVLDTKTPTVTSDLSLEQLDVAALAGFLPPDGGINRLTGVFDGKLNLKLDKGTAANVSGRVSGSNVTAAGPALKGGTYATQTLVLDVAPTAVAMPGGVGELAGARVRIGAEQNGQPIALTFDQGKVTVTGDASEDAGKVSAVVDVDVGRLAQQLPQLFKLREGVRLTGGTLNSTNDVSFTGDRAVVASETKLENVAGTNNGKAIALRPITVTASATKVGQGELLQALRDLSLNLRSGFATVDVKGASVGDVAGTIRGELADAQRELGQFVDFGQATLAGAFDADLRGTGGVPSPTNPVTVTTTATIRNLQYAAAGKDPVRQPLVKLIAGGKLTPGDEAAKAATRIDDPSLVLLTGSEQSPSLRLDAKAAVAELPPGGGFRVADAPLALSADIDRLRQEMPGVVPAGSAADAGTVTLTATASAASDGTTTRLAVPSGKVSRNNGQSVVDLTDTTVTLNDGLQSAGVNVSVPDAKSAYALLQAFQSPAAPATNGEPPPAPMTVTSGSLTLKASVSQDPHGGTLLKVPTLAGQNIGIAQGDSAYQVGSLAGAIDTTTDATGALRPKGNITLGNLVVLNKGQPQVTENQLAIAFDLALDSAKKNATINDFVVDAKSSGAIRLTAKGAIRDYTTTRAFDDVLVTLAGDWAKLWPLAKPFVAPDPESPLADLKIAGPIDRQLRVAGSLPANVPFNEAIKSLKAEGGLSVADLQAYGLHVQNLDLPITLADGKAEMAAPDGKSPSPAVANGGTIDLGNVVLNLATKTNRLTIPPGKKILSNVALNGVLAKSLNSYGIPLFAEANSEAAKFDLTCVVCDALPVKDLTRTGVDRANSNDEHGTAEFRVSFTNVQLGGEVVAGVDKAIGFAKQAGVLKFDDNGIGDQLRGDVRDARVLLADGKVTVENFTLQGGQQGHDLFSLSGSAGLGKGGTVSVVPTIPADLFERLGPEAAALFANGLQVPLNGRKGRGLTFDQNRMAQSFQQGVLKNGLPNLLEQLGKKDKDKKRNRRDDARSPASQPTTAATTAPAAREKDDPLNDLIDAFTRDKADKKDSSKDPKKSSSKKSSSKKNSSKDDGD